jgi:microcystin-dependent protein
VHVGGNQPGPGLSVYDVGEAIGIDTVTLLQTEAPTHTHSIVAQTVDQGDNRIPGPALNLANQQIYSAATPNAQLNDQAVSPAGGGQPHNNLMPYLTFNFNIALQGVFPPRS